MKILKTKMRLPFSLASFFFSWRASHAKGSPFPAPPSPAPTGRRPGSPREPCAPRPCSGSAARHMALKNRKEARTVQPSDFHNKAASMRRPGMAPATLVVPSLVTPERSGYLAAGSWRLVLMLLAVLIGPAQATLSSADFTCAVSAKVLALVATRLPPCIGSSSVDCELLPWAA